MEKIEHRTVCVNGINMHVAEIGEGPVILFLHGFPELWYSWRHQMLSLASRGYRAIAPDLRGYGDTDAPPSPDSYSTLHIAGDIVALLDALGIDKAFLVAQDFGAYHAWNLCLFRPDRVRAHVSLSVPYRPRDPSKKPLQTLRSAFGDDYYICRFQEPGQAEEEFARHDTATLFKKLFSLREARPVCVPKEIGFGGPPDAPATSPSWLSEDDANYYASKFIKKGFTGGLNYYRALDLNWELLAPWTGAKIQVPTKFIVGDQDLTYNTPGVKEYMNKGGFKRDVPLLEDVVVMEGVGHYINQEKPEEISEHIYEFIQKF